MNIRNMGVFIYFRNFLLIGLYEDYIFGKKWVGKRILFCVLMVDWIYFVIVCNLILVGI